MDVRAAAEAILARHARKKRVRPWGPGDLKKAAARPRKSEVIDYSISGDLDRQYTAPGAYSGDFGGGGGGTQHATRVRYVAGQTDRASGEYARSSVDDIGRWRNDQPMALDAAMKSRKVRLAIRQAATVAREVMEAQRSAYERWARNVLQELDTVTCSNADFLTLTPVTLPDGGVRIKATCDSCGATSEARPGQKPPVMLHDELSCRFDFCSVCGGKAVERGVECPHSEGKVVFFEKIDGRWRELRPDENLIREAVK